MNLPGKDLQTALEEQKDMYLWVIVELTKNLLEKEEKKPTAYGFYLYALNKFKEDAFFAGKSKLNYRNPFGKKGSISMEEINQLIYKIPKN